MWILNSPSFFILLMNIRELVGCFKTINFAFERFAVAYFRRTLQMHDYLLVWTLFCPNRLLLYIFLDASLDLCLDASLHRALNYRTFCWIISKRKYWSHCCPNVRKIKAKWTLRSPLWGEVGDGMKDKSSSPAGSVNV